MNTSKNRPGMLHLKKILPAFVLMLLPILAFGQEAAKVVATTPAPETRYSSIIAYTLLGVTILLLLVIYFLSKAVVLSARTKMERAGSVVKTVAKAIALLMLFYAGDLSAQATVSATAVAPAPEAPSTVSAYVVYLLLGVLFLEFSIILYFTSMIFSFLKPVQTEEEKKAVAGKNWFANWFYKGNTEEEIASLDLGHNYDGIKELDNDVPGWWKYGFYVSIIIAVVYLYVYHVGKLAPLQQEELSIAMANAEKKKAQFQKEASNSVDENTVTMLSGADLEAGKALFVKAGACATCHGEDGSGMVNGAPGIGPNLTDKYWLHKGSIKDIFYSIKYGWPEKGMKPWKDDYSPQQIAQLSSFVSSLQGSNPAAGKEKQGELWEEAPKSDSTKVK